MEAEERTPRRTAVDIGPAAEGAGDEPGDAHRLCCNADRLAVGWWSTGGGVEAEGGHESAVGEARERESGRDRGRASYATSTHEAHTHEAHTKHTHCEHTHPPSLSSRSLCNALLTVAAASPPLLAIAAKLLALTRNKLRQAIGVLVKGGEVDEHGGERHVFRRLAQPAVCPSEERKGERGRVQR